VISVTDQFTPLSATFGGLLIGVAASLLLWTHGRVAGISGIWGGLVRPDRGDVAWRVIFVAGLLAGGLVVLATMPGAFGLAHGRALPALAASGLLVGVGTRMGSGCTSGHGVCGLSVFSPRSAVAVATFVAIGMVTATAIGAFGGAH
jgi:uncharacterized membrane protein YedE/YeeE